MIIFPLLMFTLQGVIWTKLSDTSFGCPCGVDKNTKFSNHEEKQIGKARIVGWLVLLRLVRIFLYSRKDLSMSLTTSSSMAVITITTTSSEAVMLTIPTPPSCTSDMSCLMAGSTSFSDNIVSCCYSCLCCAESFGAEDLFSTRNGWSLQLTVSVETM